MSRPLIQKKRLGQVFLREHWPCQKITQTLINSGVNSVLEIGPGGGILTDHLLSQGLQVLAIEKDPPFAQRLAENHKQDIESNRLQILESDILKAEVSDWIHSAAPPWGICGNIPYHISTPILQWTLPWLPKMRIAVLMVQWEFAERLVASPSTKAYGSLSVYTQLRSQVRLEFKVPRGCFYPVPKVDSAVISLRTHEKAYDELELKEVELITRAAFNYRRKMLSNSLQAVLKDVDLSRIPYDLSRRAETLSPKDFLELAKFVIRQRG